MYFKSITDFLHMGGYAPFVWTAYGIVAIVLIANIIIPMRDKAKLSRQLTKK